MSSSQDDHQNSRHPWRPSSPRPRAVAVRSSGNVDASRTGATPSHLAGHAAAASVPTTPTASSRAAAAPPASLPPQVSLAALSLASSAVPTTPGGRLATTFSGGGGGATSTPSNPLSPADGSTPAPGAHRGAGAPHHHQAHSLSFGLQSDLSTSLLSPHAPPQEPALVVFSGGTAFNSVAGASSRRVDSFANRAVKQVQARQCPPQPWRTASLVVQLLSVRGRRAGSSTQREGPLRGRLAAAQRPANLCSGGPIALQRAVLPACQGRLRLMAEPSADVHRLATACLVAPPHSTLAGHLRALTTRVAHVLPVSDDGGSTAEVVRVLGGPAVGDIRSRCLRLADDSDTEVRFYGRMLSCLPPSGGPSLCGPWRCQGAAVAAAQQRVRREGTLAKLGAHDALLLPVACLSAARARPTWAHRLLARTPLARIAFCLPSRVQARAVKALLAHRLPSADPAAAKAEWYSVVEGEHPLWRGVSDPYKHVIRAFLVHFHTQIISHASERFNFSNGSIGEHRGGGASVGRAGRAGQAPAGPSSIAVAAGWCARKRSSGVCTCVCCLQATSSLPARARSSARSRAPSSSSAASRASPRDAPCSPPSAQRCGGHIPHAPQQQQQH